MKLRLLILLAPFFMGNIELVHGQNLPFKTAKKN